MRWKSFLFSTSIHNMYTDLGLLFLRVFAGFAMALAHGQGKVPPSEGFIEGVSNLGFPFPVFYAWAAGLSEFLGGILVALGLMTRPASLMLCITMAVAAFLRHGDDPFSSQEKALLYLMIFFLTFFSGSGRFGLDAKIK